MRVWCVGAGAVGGTVAARLARCGVEPPGGSGVSPELLVLDANRDHVRRLRDPGLEVGGIDGGARTKLAAYTLDEAAGELGVPPDVVLVAVRSQATEGALRPLTPLLQSTSDVVSLQNGLNEDTIAALAGADRTIGCVVGIGATWVEPGKVTLDATGDLTIGRLDGGTDERLVRVGELLRLAFPTKISTNIRGDLWGKMLVNSMTVLGALGGMLTGEVLVTRERRRVVAEVIAEGVRVGMAEGIELPAVLGVLPPALVKAPDRWAEAMERVLVRVGEAFGAIRSVTWRDFELGRATEIDAVTGEIVRRGERHGVPVPLSERVYGLLREIEAGERRPDVENFDEVSRLVPAAG